MSERQQRQFKVVEYKFKVAELKRLTEVYKQERERLYACIARARDSGMDGAPSPRHLVVASRITIYGRVMTSMSA